MTFSITFGWNLVPIFGTIALIVIAVWVSYALSNGSDEAAGMILMPAQGIATILAIIMWVTYFLMGAP